MTSPTKKLRQTTLLRSAKTPLVSPHKPIKPRHHTSTPALVTIPSSDSKASSDSSSGDEDDQDQDSHKSNPPFVLSSTTSDHDINALSKLDMATIMPDHSQDEKKLKSIDHSLGFTSQRLSQKIMQIRDSLKVASVTFIRITPETTPHMIKLLSI